MRRLFFIFLLFLFIPAESQVIRASGAYNVVQASGGYCAEFQAVYNYWTNKPDATRAGYYNTMVSDLVDAGYWARMEYFHFEANHSNSDGEADVNWLNPGTFDLVETGGGSLTYTVDNGYLGDGTNYLNTQFNPTSDAVHMSINNSTLGFYFQHDPNPDGGHGVNDGTSYLAIWPDTYGTLSARINAAGQITVANTNASGMFIFTRRGANNAEVYRNGSSIVEDGAYASYTFPDALVSALSTTGGNLSTNEVSCDFAIDAVSDAEALEISTIINTCMTSIGTNVY